MHEMHIGVFCSSFCLDYIQVKVCLQSEYCMFVETQVINCQFGMFCAYWTRCFP